jgi:hypothetical protein
MYADTSVFGGCFDDEYSEESMALFERVRKGKFTLVISTTLLRELNRAPKHIQEILAKLPVDAAEYIEISGEIRFLRDKYIEAGILPASAIADAEHIASASVAEVDFLVSWNFKHIVHFEKINAYQAINLLHGYKPIHIFSPKEVIEV